MLQISKIVGDDKAKIAEFTDLMGAVYQHNQKYGFYGHDDSFWNYDSEGKPNRDMLNQKAFAHFTQIIIMQDPNDLKILKKYFYNSFQVYLDMMEELR